MTDNDTSADDDNQENRIEHLDRAIDQLISSSGATNKISEALDEVRGVPALKAVGKLGNVRMKQHEDSLEIVGETDSVYMVLKYYSSGTAEVQISRPNAGVDYSNSIEVHDDLVRDTRECPNCRQTAPSPNFAFCPACGTSYSSEE